MKDIGITKFDGKNIYGYGNIRLAPQFYNHLLKNISIGKSILDIGCGDGIVGTVVNNNVDYLGVDIGAGCYEELEDDKIMYIRDYDELLASIENNKSDITMLVNVLEHTFDFTGLFEKAIQNTNEYCLVSLPNEENIHNIFDLVFKKGLKSHNLDMVGKHVNHRHLWFIQIEKAENILSAIAKKYGFILDKKCHTISYPNTLWKRIIYKALMGGGVLEYKSKMCCMVIQERKVA